MLLAVFEIAAAAPPKKPHKVSVGGDSTSYIYYHSQPSVDLFYWEKSVRIAPPPPPQVTVSPLVDTLCAQLTKNSQPLFAIPETRPRLQNSVVTFEINETEYLVGIPTDNTSYMYRRRDRDTYTHADSLVMYMPFDLTKLGNFTLPFYGIDAWQIEIENKVPERFHIDLGSKKSSIEFPSEMLIPMILSLILILIANFYSHGYIHRLLMINCFYNAFNNAASERNISAEKAGWTLFANYILNVSMFALIIMAKYGINQPFYCLLALLIGCGSVIVIFLIKLLVSMFFSNLFLCRDTFKLHYTNLSYILQMLGVVLLPINFCMVYIGYQFTVETLFVIGAGVCILAELIKLIRLIKIIFDKHFSTFYLFLYLCGVEFLPVMLAVKILSR
ncbi:MAG: DUF4271 domain-containing protein [Bacteroidales bacterium]|nr:DUF4271 domain-containing protein [Bacteroidales bacterium]